MRQLFQSNGYSSRVVRPQGCARGPCVRTELLLLLCVYVFVLELEKERTPHQGCGLGVSSDLVEMPNEREEKHIHRATSPGAEQSAQRYTLSPLSSALPYR